MWQTDYVDTTCDDWVNVMSQDDNTVAAAFLLQYIWKSDGVGRRPPQRLVRKFNLAMGKKCESDLSQNIVFIAGFVYADQRITFKP